MNCLDGNRIFFFTSRRSQKALFGKCLCGGEYGPLQPVAAEVSGQSRELLLPALWPSSSLFGSPCAVPLALGPPEYCWTLQPAQPGCRPPPLPSRPELLAVAPTARYRGGMRLPQEISFNCDRNWLQDSTKHWVSTCKENLAVLISFFAEIQH